MKTSLLILCLMLSSLTLHAQSFGVVGETFPVAEMSFLQLIEERLTQLTLSGQLEALHQRWINTVAAHTNRPTPLRLPRALKTQCHYYRPEIVLKNAITDRHGQVLYPQGTKVNALATLSSYTPCWLFLNGEDPAQVRWAHKALSQCTNPKLILTEGAISQAEKEFNQVIYFDQAGHISQKLALHVVPARVQRERNQLRIEELAIKENGDVL